MNNPQLIVDRYVALWKERDASSRRAGIAELWRPDAVHYIGTRKVRGHGELEARIAASHEKNVRDAGFVFRADDGVRTLHDAVTLGWRMVPAAGGDAAARGLEFLLLGADGCITADYQFIIG